jgi:hypothetical protein
MSDVFKRALGVVLNAPQDPKQPSHAEQNLERSTGDASLERRPPSTQVTGALQVCGRPHRRLLAVDPTTCWQSDHVRVLQPGGDVVTFCWSS